MNLKLILFAGMILSLVIPVSQIHAYGQSFSPDSGPLDCRTDIEGFVFESATYQKTGITDVVSCIYDKGVVGVYYGPLGSERSCDDLQTTISAQVNAPGNEDFNELTSNTHWAFSIFVPVGLSGVADDLVWQVENKNLAFVCSTDKKVEEEVNPFEDTAISFVTTRGHTEEFAFADPRIVSGQSVTGYGTSGNIPGFEEGKCPSEVVIYVHGFQNSHADALVNLDDLQNSLGKNDYEIPIIGFSWDSDTGPLDFADAGLIAKLNGPKLAAFIKDYKSSCSNTKIRLMSHSLGAQVVLSTLESLHDDTKWNSCGYGKDKITSVHVLGAAVPNTSISKQSNQYGNAIESEVGIFHNKFNNEDNVLSIAYAVAGSGQALGEEGAATVTNKPSNYHQQDVTREVGNDHSGYNKESTAYNSNDPEKDGVIDDVVRDWKNQRYSTHPSCNYVDTSPTPGNSAGTDGSFGGISDQLGGIGEQVGGISDQLGGIGEQVEEISDIAKNIPVEDIKDKANEAIKQIPSSGGGCLIATATYGSELAPQVQQLRELRDNSLLQTESGTSFMNTFNDFYYSFSPHIADYERENPLFKETVKIAITPMISSLSILNYVNMNSEESVLGYGISLIVLNLAMYVGIPAVVIIGIKKKF